MVRKIKISFEIEDNFDVDGFRSFIKMLLSDDEKYEVFIISNHDSSNRIMNIGEKLKLDNSHIIICNFTENKIQAIIDNNIDIHLDNLQSTILLVDETTEAYGILVTKNLNKFYLTPDYILVFDRLVKQIENEQN